VHFLVVLLLGRENAHVGEHQVSYMKEAAHLVRLAGVFLAGFLLFLVVRQQVVPAGFGKYGHFRAGALDDNRAHPIVFAGRSACAGCHEDQLKVLESSKHAIVSCEACHGPQAKHANADDPSAAKPALPDTTALCARCHEASSAKPQKFPQVVSKEHSGGESCKTCHMPHQPQMK
jgi:hypothetical protein